MKSYYLSNLDMLFYFVWVLTFLTSGISTAVPTMDTVIKDFHGKEFLDGRGEYLLEWTIDWRNRMMVFNITVETSGWVGFGFSKDGQMKDADMVVAGVNPDQRPYITDFHADCHRELVADNKQDWNLLRSVEAAGKTNIQVSRLIDTCDSDDYPITEDLVFLLWAFGETDNLEYHHQNRGSYKLYLLDPVVHPAPSSANLPRWRAVKQNFTLPAKPTTYWCSIHKAPTLPRRKHHFIEFNVVLEDPHDVAVKHTHHFSIYRCLVPPGGNLRATFEPLVSYQGEECYFNDHNIIPINLCRTMVYVWALGARPLVLPDHVGFPFMETQDEYYMLESHYDNPESSGGITYTAGIEAVYTPRLRPQEGSAIVLQWDFYGLVIIPPGTQNFKMAPHCSPECTSAMFPAEGIDVFAIHTHTHGSGRKNKLHHYRNGKELPWIVKDDNYDFMFQNPRPLQNDRKLLPGDHLTLECVYDDTWTNVSTVTAFGSKDEMCLQTVYHTVRIPYSWCSSMIPDESLLRHVGVRNFTWDLHNQERIVTSPLALRGKTFAHVLNDLTKWTRNLRETVQTEVTSHPQITTCPLTLPSARGFKQGDTKALGYASQMMMGTYVKPNIDPSTPVIISRNPMLDIQFNRVRTCAPVPTF